jgi:hypothetical protein
MEPIPVTAAPLGSDKLKDCMLVDGQLCQDVILVPKQDPLATGSFAV